jgi:hypothetical protein
MACGKISIIAKFFYYLAVFCHGEVTERQYLCLRVSGTAPGDA